MEFFEQILEQIKNWIWGPPLLLFLFGTGAFLTYILRGVQVRYLGYACKQVFARKQEESEGDISHFEALMTSLAGAIGTGNIVGVSTALVVGGLGSLFWMWVMTFFGMAIKYAESLLAVKYRVVDKRGEMIGGPMEYMERGLGWKKLAMIFSVLGILGTIGTGNMVQVNAIAESMTNLLDINPLITGIGLAVITAFVIVGGVKSIGHVAGVLVPVMALFYLSGGILIILLNIDKLPNALMLIFESAFQGQAALGGFAGASALIAVQMGVSRSVFSSEAGLGISSIAAAAAKIDAPARQALITMTGALISTIVVCTITGLVIALTGLFGQTDASGHVLSGATLAIEAFKISIPGGGYIVTIGLILFAFSTIIAWAYYGEKCCEYLFGEKSIPIYRILFILIIIPSALLKLEVVWLYADIGNGLMVIPNLLALIFSWKVISKETKDFLDRVEKEKKGMVKS